ncbi:WxL domain-containing protein [Enterococcus rivorum]|uniref:Cell surface protein n=1 Tax=Enterococcus rivorum TaxID=762845 RepID=A0A1E5KWN8_9ENTE|nr:WxL domain-containing protein [Enterococcus rivorum]MBP2099134.1 hypothetical protein [Enterococcus rivorum]OEH82283.1 cell surface protein [Enterococcus rivorum]
MKKTVILYVSLLSLATVAFGAIASAAEYDTNGVVKFKADTSVTPPVDPTNPDPENPVTPVDPTNPSGPNPGTAGPLSIDYASSFQFGEQTISTVDKVYYAAIQKFADDTTGPNYVQITDKRGTLEGWSLSVKQNSQFKTAASNELTGAKITLKNAGVASDLDSDTTLVPSTVKSEVVLNPDGSEQTVVTAAENQGVGTWVYRFGNDATQGATSVELEVPGKTVKRAEQYSTTMTWVLQTIPGNP